MSDTGLFTHPRGLCRLLARSLVAVLLAAACALALLHPGAASSHTLTPNSGCCDPWIHSATAANTYASWTDLDNGFTNNTPTALVFVTPTWTPNGEYASAFDGANVGVWYDIATNKWAIFNEDNSPMPLGAAFNVIAFTPADAAFVFTATAATISGSSADLVNPVLDTYPNVVLNVLLVTPTWAGGIYDTHPLGVYFHYETGHWAIFHEDGAPMVPGTTYNIASFPPQGNRYVHTVTSANSRPLFAYSSLDNPVLNGASTALVWITQAWTEPCRLCNNHPLNNSAVSVFYQPVWQRWCIYNNLEAAMPTNALFDVIALPGNG